MICRASANLAYNRRFICARRGLPDAFMETTTLALLVLVPLLVWRIYSRLKRLTSRQQSHLWRHWTAVILCPLLLLGLAFSTKFDVLPLSCLAAGALAGGWLGFFGIKLTRFENTGKTLFYTPNRYLGMSVAMLFAARMIYRGMELYMNSRALIPQPNEPFGQSPLTLLTLGLVAGYYAIYGWGLVRWRLRQKTLPAAV